MVSFDALAVLIANRLAALCAGQTWSTEGGVQKALQIHRYHLPQPTTEAARDSDLPFVIVRPISGGDEGVSGQDTVRLIAALYCAATPDTDCPKELDRLLGRILQIPTGQSFSPYSFERLTYHLGEFSSDPRIEGRQPHPEYYLTADLIFMRETAFIEE
jgi:hypothetical protein